MPSLPGSVLLRRTMSARDCGAVFLYCSRRATSCLACARLVCSAAIWSFRLLISFFVGLNSRKYQATMMTTATTAAMM